MTDVRKFTVDEWDIFFLYNFLFKQYDELSDRKMWGGQLNRIERVKFAILNKIFK